MSRYLAIVVCLTTISCGDDKDDAHTGDTGEDGGVSCANAILSQHPLDGESNAYYRTIIDFGFATDSPDAAIVVTDETGAEVAGSTVNEGARSTFTPDEPLANGAAYTVNLTWECDPVTSTFTVGDVGGGPVDGAALGGNAYVLDLREGRYVRPAGIESLLSTMLQVNLLIGIDSGTDTELNLIGAVADDNNEQDFCAPSIEFPTAADFSENPYFWVQADSLPIVVAGDTVEVTDLTLSGTFAPDSLSIEGVAFVGSIDTRPLATAMGEDSTEAALCELLASTMNVECDECADGSGPLCLNLVVDTMSAPLANGVTIIEWTDQQVKDDPDCLKE